METFGEWLRQQRSLRKLTREEFAKRVGCSVSLLRKIEYDVRRPSAQIAELIANSLELPPAERSTFVRVARGELSLNRLLPEQLSLTTTPPSASKTSLPVLPTPLIGRQRELAELTRLLREPECRLLTLTGPGGIGKTRLAIETAAHVQDSFADGGYFVPLASASSARFLVPIIADAIGFAFHHASHADPRDQLFSYLKEKQMLLLADNLEQLLSEPGIELLAELLLHAPQVKVLATSRECLGLREEWVFEVQGLPVPESTYTEGSAQNTSVELFLQRARRADVGFTATVQDFPAIVRICRLVDGMPLGIELAAAWVRTLSCEEIAREIERGLDILSNTGRDIPARHRSMRAVFEHSWKLLSAEEQSVLLRLSVFRGFGREAAQQVAGATLPVLSALVTKSLIRRSGAGRYDLHELIRQFASEQLAEHPEEQAAAQAVHARYYLSYFSQADGRLRSPAQQQTLAELTDEMGNFLAAWDWAITNDEFGLIEQTLRMLWLFYDTRGWFHEGLDILNRAVNALEKAHGESPREAANQVVLAHLLTAQAWLAYRLADYQPAQAMLERSLEILRPLQERRVMVESLPFLGMLMEMRGNYARALELYSEGLQMTREIGDRWYEALHLIILNGVLATTAVMPRHKNAHEQLQAAVAGVRTLGDPRLTAFGLRLLSYSALALGRYDEARAVLAESLDLLSSVGDRWGLGSAYRGLGIAAQAQHRHQEAVDMFRKSLDTFTELGASAWVARVLADLSRCLFAVGNQAEAEHAWREALRLATEVHATPTALEALASVASLRARQGQMEHALELILIVVDHPASLQETKNRANDVRAEVEAALTLTQIEAIQARVDGKTLDEVVEELLKG